MRRRTLPRSRRLASWLPAQLLQQLRRQGWPRFQLSLKWGGIHLLTLALALLTLSLLINFGGQVLQSARLEARKLSLATEVALLEAENQQLLGAVEYAESDANVERIAREQLGYAREGDIVILPQEPLPTPEPPAAVPTPLPPSVSTPNWQRWWLTFFAPDEEP